MAALKVVCALVLCMLVVEPMSITALSCGDVDKQMTPCIKYLQNGGNLPPSCCTGVRALNSEARTTSDRQTVCKCLQDAAKTITGLKANLAEGLPGKCGVNIPYKISTSTNCNNVK
ncbi:non-specific lipid-transfer protein P5-like [Durio zibethinus]|uniref:Non-specific lipid-transfer protein n=1 Tax=Durio zibethinus TaxID=66656 RepID=A0A6P5X399_DURZI|nr:non-specific lipid-transfer protein P5-like [Durio zibethinus]